MAFDPRRLAEIIVTDPAGPGRRGTGYRVTTTTVLTAAHVIAGAQSVSVRFDAQRPTEWAVTGRPEWCDSTTDLAVLSIIPPDTEPVIQARYGRLADVGAFIDAHTAGFPWWKLRQQTRGRDGVFALRDLHHATGRIAVASNRRTGRLEVEVSAPRDLPEATQSPWEGMSGAPLWVVDRIIGVITEHHHHEGPNWLTAIRIDRCLEAAGADRPELAELLGLSDSPNALTDLTGTAPSPVTVHTVLPTIAEFTGRAQEIHAVTARVTEAAQTGQIVAIHAIDGMPGVGKTALATRLWHLLAEQFPQRLFVDLHAHTPGMIPADPADALAGLLRTVGVDPRQLPDGLEQRAAMWRERMAGQHTLLVLDNAASSAQVNPLLPGSPHSLVLITSRRHLGDLATTAVDVSLDALPPDDAAQMFVSLAPRAAGDRDRVAEIVALCGRLPLAIRLIARLFAKHHQWSMADLISRTTAKLLTVRVEHETIAAAFDLSYQNLTAEQQRFFRMLSLHPGGEIDLYAAAALTGLRLEDAGDRLEALFGDHLIDEVDYDRYRMHDLIAAYARTLAAREPADRRERAVGRLLDYYQHTAVVAAGRMSRSFGRARRPSPPLSTPAPDLPDYISATAWLRDERANLLACIHHVRRGHHQHDRLIDLTAGLGVLLRFDGPWTQAIDLHTQALNICQDLGDRPGQAGALLDLGTARRLTDDKSSATQDLQQALDIYLDLGDRLGQAAALVGMGTVRRQVGAYPAATQDLQQALDISRDLGDRLGMAAALVELGTVRYLTDDYAAATQDLQQALDICQDLGDRLGQANALNVLGRVRYETGNYGEATESLEQALDIYGDLGGRLGQGGALLELGRVRYMTGDSAGATRDLQRALDIYKDLGTPVGQADALNSLGGVRYETGDYAGAVQYLQQALDIYLDMGDPLGQANALANLGNVRCLTADYPGATHDLQRALDIYQDLGDRLGQANVLTILGGLVRCLTGDYAGAVQYLRQAMDIYLDLGDRLGQAGALNDLGRVRCLTGDYAAATHDVRQALDIYLDLGIRLGQAGALNNLGRVGCLTGDHAKATHDLRQALDIYQDLGFPRGEVDVLNNMGALRRACDDLIEAGQWHRQALELACQINSEWDEAYARAGLGRCALAAGDRAEALQHLRAALGIFQRIGAAEAAEVAAEVAELAPE